MNTKNCHYDDGPAGAGVGKKHRKSKVFLKYCGNNGLGTIKLSIYISIAAQVDYMLVP